MANANEKAPSTGAAQATGPKALYRVKGPGSVLHGGETVPCGELIELTAEDAKSIAEFIESADAPQIVPPGKHVDGLYQVVGPGGLISGGKFYAAGQKVRLAAAEAKSAGVPLRLIKAA